MSKIAIGGLLETPGLVLLKIMGVHSGPGVAGLVLSTLGKHGINVICVVSSTDSSGRENMSLAVGYDDLDQSLGLLQTIKEDIDAVSIECQKNVCVLSIYGPHFSDRPTIAGMMFQAMSEGNIDIQAISTSVSTVSCIIAEKDLETAREQLGQNFLIP
jgi:aspartokinase